MQPSACLVALVAVDEEVLGELVAAALGDAGADEVTPSSRSDGAWDPERIAWLQAFHRDRRAGLDGPDGERTWAVRSRGCVVGGARLRWVRPGRVLETGIWLTRGARGQGVGSRVLEQVAQQARSAGAQVLRAETSADNVAALRILAGSGFELSRSAGDRAVTATLRLH